MIKIQGGKKKIIRIISKELMENLSKRPIKMSGRKVRIQYLELKEDMKKISEQDTRLAERIQIYLE
jgi:hypothetical protein